MYSWKPSFTDPGREGLVKHGTGIRCRFLAKSQPYVLAASWWHFQTVVGCCLGANPVWIHCLLITRDYVFVETIFHIWRCIGLTPQPVVVRFIFRKQQFRIA